MPILGLGVTKTYKTEAKNMFVVLACCASLLCLLACCACLLCLLAVLACCACLLCLLAVLACSAYLLCLFTVLAYCACLLCFAHLCTCWPYFSCIWEHLSTPRVTSKGPCAVVWKAGASQRTPEWAILASRLGRSAYLLQARLPDWEVWESASIQIGSQILTSGLYCMLWAIGNKHKH